MTRLFSVVSLLEALDSRVTRLLVVRDCVCGGGFRDGLRVLLHITSAHTTQSLIKVSYVLYSAMSLSLARMFAIILAVVPFALNP